jgi:hypothetical protein
MKARAAAAMMSLRMFENLRFLVPGRRTITKAGACGATSTISYS